MAEVPFVDALNTILDPSLPLTVIEWDEWGNPLHDPEVYAYMKSYTPYENVDDRRVPADPRHHQPQRHAGALPRAGQVDRAAARHRARAAPFLLKTEMGAGHGGRSGRYDAWREEAFTLSWIIDVGGALQTHPGRPATTASPAADAARPTAS